MILTSTLATLGGDCKAGGRCLILSNIGWQLREGKRFRMTANALGGGSGWVVLAYNLHTRSASTGRGTTMPTHREPAALAFICTSSHHMDYGAAAASFDHHANGNGKKWNRRRKGSWK